MHGGAPISALVVLAGLAACVEVPARLTAADAAGADGGDPPVCSAVGTIACEQASAHSPQSCIVDDLSVEQTFPGTWVAHNEGLPIHGAGGPLCVTTDKAPLAPAEGSFSGIRTAQPYHFKNAAVSLSVSMRAVGAQATALVLFPRRANGQPDFTRRLMIACDESGRLGYDYRDPSLDDGRTLGQLLGENCNSGDTVAAGGSQWLIEADNDGTIFVMVAGVPADFGSTPNRASVVLTPDFCLDAVYIGFGQLAGTTESTTACVDAIGLDPFVPPPPG